MKKLWFQCTMLLCLMLTPSVAFASTTSTPVSDVLTDVLHSVAYLVALTLAALLALAARWVALHFKVKIPESWMSSANVWLDKGIAYAEERGKQSIKNEIAIDSSDKLNWAVTFLLSMVDDKKLLSLGEAKLKQLIEARLNENRALNVGELPPSDHADTVSGTIETTPTQPTHAPDIASTDLVHETNGQVWVKHILVGGEAQMVNITQQLNAAGYKKGS